MTDLSAVAVEQLRDLRARLNRIEPGPMGERSVAPLTKGFFDVCARVGLERLPGAKGLEPAARIGLPGLAKEADLAALRAMVSVLAVVRETSGGAWRCWMNTGILQAILTRRLVLGGKERL